MNRNGVRLKLERCPTEIRIPVRQPSEYAECPSDPNEACFDKSFRSALRYIENNKKAIAYDMAVDWEDHKLRRKIDEMERKFENQPPDISGSVGKELDRQKRAEQYMELAKSYQPTFERFPERDEPDLEP